MYLNKKRVNIAMASKGYRQKDLAAACEVSPNWLGKILKNESCTPYMMSKLTQALGVTVEYLAEEE